MEVGLKKNQHRQNQSDANEYKCNYTVTISVAGYASRKSTISFRLFSF